MHVLCNNGSYLGYFWTLGLNDYNRNKLRYKRLLHKWDKKVTAIQNNGKDLNIILL